MNRKKLDPSEADLRQSALKAIASILNTPTEDELTKGEWVTVNQLVKITKCTRASIAKRLDRKVESGEMEVKKESCISNGKVCLMNFYRITDEITRPY
jgi:hypothetical protein